MLRKMRNTGLLTALLVMIAALLGGCMYPEEKSWKTRSLANFTWKRPKRLSSSSRRTQGASDCYKGHQHADLRKV